MLNSAHPDRKQKIKHELTEMLELFFSLAFFLVALAIYDMAAEAVQRAISHDYVCTH